MTGSGVENDFDWSHTMDTQQLSTPGDILQEALRREQDALAFYDGQAAQCRVEFVRELLERLKDEEFKHVRMIEGLLARLNLG